MLRSDNDMRIPVDRKRRPGPLQDEGRLVVPPAFVIIPGNALHGRRDNNLQLRGNGRIRPSYDSGLSASLRGRRGEVDRAIQPAASHLCMIQMAHAARQLSEAVG